MWPLGSEGDLGRSQCCSDRMSGWKDERVDGVLKRGGEWSGSE